MTAKKPFGFAWFEFCVGFVAAGVLIGGIHMLSPPEWNRVTSFVDSKVDHFDDKLKKIAAMRDRVEATPFGEGRQDNDALAAHAMDFGPKGHLYTRSGLPVGSANALLLRDTELRRINIEKALDDIEPDLESDELSAFKNVKLSKRSYIEDMASVAYERPFGKTWITEADARGMVARLESLETVIIYRIGKITKAKPQDDDFVPGYMAAEAFVFDVDSGNLIGSFTFASTNSQSVEMRDRRTDAEWYLKKDLSDNLEVVFWANVRRRMPKAVFRHEVKVSPFSALALAQAEQR